MGRIMKSVDDLADVNLPSNASKSRDYDPGFNNDTKAQAQAAAQLGYSLHGGKCTQCGGATNESGLCHVGRALYQRMRDAGVVA